MNSEDRTEQLIEQLKSSPIAPRVDNDDEALAVQTIQQLSQHDPEPDETFIKQTRKQVLNHLSTKSSQPSRIVTSLGRAVLPLAATLVIAVGAWWTTNQPHSQTNQTTGNTVKTVSRSENFSVDDSMELDEKSSADTLLGESETDGQMEESFEMLAPPQEDAYPESAPNNQLTSPPINLITTVIIIIIRTLIGS